MALLHHLSVDLAYASVGKICCNNHVTDCGVHILSTAFLLRSKRLLDHGKMEPEKVLYYYCVSLLCLVLVLLQRSTAVHYFEWLVMFVQELPNVCRSKYE